MRTVKRTFAIAVLLGFCVFLPGFVASVDSREIQTIQRMAHAGDSEAQRALGEAYAAGYRLPKDRDAALRWLTLSARQGNAAAQNSLASLYRRLGDPVQADRWRRIAESSGWVDAVRSISDHPFNSL